MASRSVAGPSPSRISLAQPVGEVEHRGVEFGRGAEARCGRPAARAKRPVPTGSARPGTAIARLRDFADRRAAASASRARASAAAIRALTARDRARRGDAGMADEGAAAPPPALVGIVAAHHHRRPVLAGDRDDAAARIGAAHQVAERRHAQMIGRDGVIFATCCRGRARPRRNRYICRRGRRRDRTSCWRRSRCAPGGRRSGWSNGRGRSRSRRATDSRPGRPCPATAACRPPVKCWRYWANRSAEN